MRGKPVTGNGVTPPRRFGKHAEPSFTVLYGESGTSKSTTSFYAFPGAYYFGPRGGVTKVARNVVGLPSETGLPLTDDGAIRTLNELMNVDPKTGRFPLQAIAEAGYTAVGLDDASILCERTAVMLDATVQGDGYKRWAVYANLLMAVRDALRGFNLHAVVNFHARPPWIDRKSGVRYKGTIGVQGDIAPVRFPPACDYVFRTVKDPEWWDPELKMYLECDPLNPDWFSKARSGLLPSKLPMNLGEILRHDGYEIPRVAGLEWIEELVEQAASAVARGSWEQFAPASEWLKAQAREKVKGWPIEAAVCAMKWAGQDFRARAYLRIARAASYAQYGLSEEGRLAGAASPVK